MASSFVLSSRRKQAKPQRLPEEPTSEGMSADVSPNSEEAIDLSTRRVAAILEDKSNLLSFSNLSHSQQLLNFCAQLAAANRGKSLSSTPPATPKRDLLYCAAAGCDERFPSRGALLWHVMEQHQHSKLLRCDNCGERFNDREQIQEHSCTDPPRPSTADGSSSPSASPDADRGSVPATAGPSFSLVEPEGQDEEEREQSETPTEEMPMPPQLLLPPPLPHNFPHFAVRPPPFMFRTPFDPRQEVFVPRPAEMNNEDDWEALMEISTTDEGEKIRQLVGDKAIPTTDPNQCILCRRVLSCKSALQMHYRTHTGERPFKCKICQRAFTTKGNLKTHMGVHRAKHSFRGVIGPPLGAMPMPPGLHAAHQCPICQKRFMTTVQLQAHIADHTQALTARLPPPPQNGPPGFPPGFPLFPFFQQHFPTSNGVDIPHAAPFNLAQLLGKQLQTEEIRVNPRLDDAPTLMKEEQKPVANMSVSPSGSSEGSIDQQHEQTDGSSVGRPESAADTKPPSHPLLLDSQQLPSSDDTPRKSSIDNPLEAMRKMWAETEPPPPRQAPILSKHQCGVCFKHFSSSSALQIHMRTHTGDKPFKCEVCGRAFTTRGNLKVHMGTHMWQQSPSRRGRRIFDASPGESSVLKSPLGISSLAPPLGLFPPAAVPGMEMMMMLWRTVCSVCQKVCASPSELEQHLKEHLSSTSEAVA